MKTILRFLLVLGVGTWLISTASAAFITTTVGETGQGPFTPSFVVPANNVLLGLAPSASNGNFQIEVSGGLPALTDGIFGAISGGNPGTNTVFAVCGGGGGSGTSVTYALNLLSAPLGYDISKIVTMGGWNDSGRDTQLYNVYYATVANPTQFVQIGATVNFNPVAAGNPSATQATIADNGGALLATGVGALRFDFAPPNGPSGAENGYSGYTELAAVGVATVPEPSTFALLCAGLLGLLGCVWRRG